MWEVDPALPLRSQRKTPTVLGGTGGNYESFAYDARDRLNPTFYVTNDSSSGGMVRFTPDPAVVAQAEQSGDYGNVLTTTGTLEWLMLQPASGSTRDTSGTFSWTSRRRDGDSNANRFYQKSEGIDVRNGFLYLQCKNLAIFAEMIFPETCLTTTSAIFCHFFGFHNIFIFSYGIFGAKCNYR